MPTFECPICNRITTVENKEQLPHRPFCSYRCKMIDLGRWFDGTYRVSEPVPTENELNESNTPEDESDNT